ncbi:DUF6379 domain-containing protein [Catenibacillus scindens]|uniref:C-glycoside deglycosidase beta subunit domain-containing protein n=1 Tax=Catenibacillus scindens TaxID=673271 RepID=UPI00320AB2E6
MLERQVIQSVGFRNIKENGKITGFQFKIRLPYYRGIFLSQLRPGTLYVDGEKVDREDIIWNINGQDHTFEEMKSNMKDHWATTTPAILKVPKEGGLSQGYHDLTYGFCFTSSYMPPAMQNNLDPDKEAFIFMPEFGHHVNSRRLIIV